MKTSNMKQPDGFTTSRKEDYGSLLKNSLYGLKQSPRQWYKRFNSFMISRNLKKSNYDSYLYFKRGHDGAFIYLLLYANDILIAAEKKDEIKMVKMYLSY